MSLEFFKVQKRMILTNVCFFQQLPWINFAFSHGFSTQKFTFSVRPLAHRSACQSACQCECRANFTRIRLFCFIKAVKNNKPGSVKNSRDFKEKFFKRTLQANFSKGLTRFLNGVSDGFLALQKMLSKRHKITDPNFKKGDTIIGALLTRNRTK
jgi:hypothetical protein